jgi:hypothetical protein
MVGRIGTITKECPDRRLAALKCPVALTELKDKKPVCGRVSSEELLAFNDGYRDSARSKTLTDSRMSPDMRHFKIQVGVVDFGVPVRHWSTFSQHLSSPDNPRDRAIENVRDRANREPERPRSRDPGQQPPVIKSDYPYGQNRSAVNA